MEIESEKLADINKRNTDEIESDSFSNKFKKEIGILTNILDLLKDLAEEDRKRIIQTILTYFNQTENNFSQPNYKKTYSNSFENNPLNNFTEEPEISPKEFLFSKSPETDVEKVACLGYYLTHYRKQPHFNTIDITKLNSEAAQRKFANSTKSVSNATEYGYLAPSGKGQKQITAQGELYVQRLPNRVAAREVMKKARKRKTGKKNFGNSEMEKINEEA